MRKIPKRYGKVWKDFPYEKLPLAVGEGSASETCPSYERMDVKTLPTKANLPLGKRNIK
jgi:hypothetical protein